MTRLQIAGGIAVIVIAVIGVTAVSRDVPALPPPVTLREATPAIPLQRDGLVVAPIPTFDTGSIIPPSLTTPPRDELTAQSPDDHTESTPASPGDSAGSPDESIEDPADNSDDLPDDDDDLPDDDDDLPDDDVSSDQSADTPQDGEESDQTADSPDG